MAKRKTIDDCMGGFVESLYEDGTVTRWKADKRLKEQSRKLKKLEWEERAIRQILKEVKGRKPA